MRCDSTRPSCRKCSDRGLSCPGYDTQRPLRWRKPVLLVANNNHDDDKSKPPQESLTPRQHAPSPLPLFAAHQRRRDDDVASTTTVLDTIAYYKALIAPDMALGPGTMSSSYMPEWLSLSKVARHLYICVVTSHRAITQGTSFQDLRTNSRCLLRHEAQAAALIRGKIDAVVAGGGGGGGIISIGDSRSRPDVLVEMAFFMSSQIQQSAYGSWRHHVVAARALDSHGSPQSDWKGSASAFADAVFVMVDIFGTTTSPIPGTIRLREATARQQRSYLDRLEDLDIDYSDTLTPVPKPLIRAVLVINILRMTATDMQAESDRQSLAEVVSEVIGLDARLWATSIMDTEQNKHSVTPEADLTPVRNDAETAGSREVQLEAWVALAQCFQSATVLYALLSLQPCLRKDCPRVHGSLENQTEVVPDLKTLGQGTGDQKGIVDAAAAYDTLMQAARFLASRRLIRHDARPDAREKSREEGHYKMITWPLVMAGVYNYTARGIIRGGPDEDRSFIAQSLRLLSTELGTMAMREAAEFLEALWAVDSEHGRGGCVGWDTIFHKEPLFLM